MTHDSSHLPVVTIKPGAQRRVLAGHPWLYSNELTMDAAAKTLLRGAQVAFQAADGRMIGTGFFNAHSLIAGRLMRRGAAYPITAADLTERIVRARDLRDRLTGVPYYRLIHAEADDMPGLIIDRFGDVLVMQANSAGMDLLTAPLVAVLNDLFEPQAVILRNDTAARALEGLDRVQVLASGEWPDSVDIIENGARFPIDLRAGQKTGWFFDQRDNRARVAAQADGLTIADLYCYGGGFGVQAAMKGARQVVAVDRSEGALQQAVKAAQLNKVADRFVAERAEIFDWLPKAISDGRRFDIVVADPPAFVKSRKDLPAGSRAYRKLAQLSARLTAPGGFLFIASCSHNMEPAPFLEQVARGLHDAGRTGRILTQSGAAPDHPVHPFLPESAYLKALWIALD